MRVISRPSLVAVGYAILLLGLSPAVAAADSWAFTPVEDVFSPDAQFDLRTLNEPVAGQNGFVTCSPDGKDFRLGNGTPVRFWCMNAGGEDKDLDHEARFLAKHGVNMVRVHAQLSPGPGSKVTDIAPGSAEPVWKAVAAMKKQGIYVTISPYWASCGLQPSWGIAGHQEAWGVLFCDAVLQSGYKAWLKALLGQANPYTHTPLAQDAAVAVIQLQNEDSMLFWTMINFINQKGQPYDELRKGFGDFAIRKYGSIDKALAAWGGDSVEDDRAHGLLGFHQVWEITTNPGGPKGERIADQIEFWTRTMYDFNKAMVKYLREELGCKQLINAGNWRVADVVHQLDAERWSYTPTEVVAINRYIGGLHVGADNGWSVEPGQGYTNDTCVLDPTAFPINAKQVVGHPYLVTESCWVRPNLYQSEGPLMVAAYSSLTGVNGFYWFSSGAREWDIIRWPWNRHPKWGMATPMEVGQFPAAAWLYRKGYVARDPGAAVHEERALVDIWHETSPLIAEESGYDPNRDAGLPRTSAVKTTVNPLAFLVGRVEVVYGGNPAKSHTVDLSTYIDVPGKTVRSVTGEERLDYGMGVCTLNAPKAQGAAGFLAKAGAIALTDITLTCSNAYATIIVTALDDQPISASRRLLLQIGTIQRPTHWADHPGDVANETKETVPGFIIDNAGEEPWRIEQAVGTLVVRNPHLRTMTVLDANGMSRNRVQGTTSGGAFSVGLPPDALYAILGE